jgi:16S rRNA C967 or C1407 C5-methylase (RsmB/RsmF family)
VYSTPAPRRAARRRICWSGTALDLLALDLKPSRCRRIQENLIASACMQRYQGRRTVPNSDTWWDGQPFDAVLADVPCTASGVVRRNPDSKWLRREEDIASFAKDPGAYTRSTVAGGPAGG